MMNDAMASELHVIYSSPQICLTVYVMYCILYVLQYVVAFEGLGV